MSEGPATANRRSLPLRWWLGIGYVGGLAGLVLLPIADLLNRLTVRLYVLFRYQIPIAPDGALPEHYGDALNVALFVPLAFVLVRWWRWSWWQAVAACVAVSGAAEAAQLGLARVSDLRDVVANGCGAVIGAALALAADRLRGRSALARDAVPPEPPGR